ncbi:unnamed protein product [Ambrosiozyma monospora]|uniref:Unnamed protein product n=1 Tax=Ambrosiozyma monospora TaxID=43982 RepID=A0A9W6Z108_AMBMO|nr:unnamed protein product [Ambrosiozyma monospora]
MNNAVYNKRIDDAPEPFLRKRVGQDGYLSSYETIEFGRLVYLSRDHHLVGKLDPRAVPAFYLGPSQKGFGYIVLVIVSGKGKGTSAKVIDTTHIDFITPENITYRDWMHRKRLPTSDADICLLENDSHYKILDSHDNFPVRLVSGEDLTSAMNHGGGSNHDSFNKTATTTTTAKDENNTTVVSKDIIHDVNVEPDVNAGTDVILEKSDASNYVIGSDIATSDGTPELGGGTSSNGSPKEQYDGQAVRKKLKTVENGHVGGGGVDVVAGAKVEDQRHDSLKDMEFARQARELTNKEFIDNTITFEELEDYEDLREPMDLDEADNIATALVKDGLQQQKLKENSSIETINVPKNLATTFNDSSTSFTMPTDKHFLRNNPVIRHVSVKRRKTHDENHPTLKQALNGPDRDEWLKAMETQLNKLIDKGTWHSNQILTDDPEIKARAVRTQWTLNKKRDSSFKARLVAMGNTQNEQTYDETYSPTPSYEVMRILLADAVKTGKIITMFDVNDAYLNADIDKDLYIHVPKGIEIQYDKVMNHQIVVYKLQKAMWGLRQSGHRWAVCWVDFLLSIGFVELKGVNCLFAKFDENGSIIATLVSWVDDCMLSCKDQESSNEIMDTILKRFQCKVSVPVHGTIDLLNINIKQVYKFGKLHSIELNQAAYINKIAARLGINKAKEYVTPMDPDFKFDPCKNKLKLSGYKLSSKIRKMREIVGALLYIAQTTRPDISFAANFYARYTLYPHVLIEKQIKRTVSYLLSTKDYCIRYTRNSNDGLAAYAQLASLEMDSGRLTGFSDADLGGDIHTRKSTVASIFMYANGPVYWKTKGASVSAESSTEAELLAMVKAGNEMIYLLRVMKFIQAIKNVKVQETLFADNTSAINMAHGCACSTRTKHLGLTVAKAHEIEEEEMIKFVYIETKDQLADILTKPIQGAVLAHIIPMILKTDG